MWVAWGDSAGALGTGRRLALCAWISEGLMGFLRLSVPHPSSLSRSLSVSEMPALGELLSTPDREVNMARLEMSLCSVYMEVILIKTAPQLEARCLSQSLLTCPKAAHPGRPQSRPRPLQPSCITPSITDGGFCSELSLLVLSVEIGRRLHLRHKIFQ